MVHNGVICVNKPSGMTSHDVVAAIRRVFGQKTGHTGTLDPAARGVLPICLGAATKLAQIMSDSDKAYRVEIIFGAETDTQDFTGNITRRAPVAFGEDEFMAAISSFAGEYNQLPPMYSAVKVGGRKLYELAREGVEVARKPRMIHIHDIKAESLDLPQRAVIFVRSSKGAYMRTLCEDIGKRLDTAAHMGQLLRTEAAGFTLQNAHALDALSIGNIIPITEIPALRPLPRLSVAPHLDKRLLSGGVLRADDFDKTPEFDKMLMFTSGGVLAGIYTLEQNETFLQYKPFIML